MKNIRKKKVLASLGVAFGVLLIGITIAFSHDSSILRSLFHLGYYRTTHIEEFTSPDDWKTCDITPKTIITRNESSYTIAVRISYEEFWKAADGETDLPLVKDGVTLANIQFQNQNDWEYTDGYYYYKADLAPGEETNSLFEAVQLSCDANLTPGDNICTETETGKECVQPENPYDGAIYHLKVKIETIQVEGKGEWQPNEEGTIYGELKSEAQENGTDEDVDFSAMATTGGGNGNGVNIKKGTETNNHPIMYYRGQVNDNNVIWGGFCWKILRTTETGGTKIFYNGLATNNQCTNDNTSLQYDISDTPIQAGQDIAKWGIPYNDYNFEGVPAWEDPIGYAGYMFDDVQGNIYDASPYIRFNNSTTMAYLARGVEYGEDRKYHLMNPEHIVIRYDAEHDDYGGAHTNFDTLVEQGYYYVCEDVRNDSCERAMYLVAGSHSDWYSNSNGIQYMHAYRLIDGDLQPDLRRKIVASNRYDSLAKSNIEHWFEINFANTSAANDLEDTVFCNDRTLTDWPLKSEEFRPISLETDEPPFESGVRLLHLNSPTYDCANEVDRFTTSGANGNAKLRYPVGLMTGDEMVMAGVPPDSIGASGIAYPFGLKDWGISMTPLGLVGDGSGGITLLNYTGNMGNSRVGEGVMFSTRIRPVVSLKYGTEFVEGGEGTLENPYVVKQ